MMFKKQIVSAPHTRVLIIVLLISLPVLLRGCPRRRFDSEAEAAFREMVGPSLNRRALIITTDRQRYKRGETIHFWIENRTGKSLWFPDGEFGVRALGYRENARTWFTIDWGVIDSPSPQPPVMVPQGVSGPYSLPVWKKIQPGPVRLLFVGSTDPNAPGVGGEVYATYVDVIFEEEIEEP